MFETKDSGARVDLAGGMVRDTATGKADPTLLLDGPMLKRWGELLDRGAAKYCKRNWCKALVATDAAAREETKARFYESAMRHMMQWLRGERDEDHAAAVFFNLNGYEAMLESDHVCDESCKPVKISGDYTGQIYRASDTADGPSFVDKRQVKALDDELRTGFGKPGRETPL